MEWLSDPNAWIGLLTLTVLELVLGIDNIVFISILSGKLSAHQQKKKFWSAVSQLPVPAVSLRLP
jgi:predicted tellurium resistance membrane protein TerC